MDGAAVRRWLRAAAKPTSEAARLAHLSPKLLGQLISEGRGPAVTRLGRGRGRMLIRADILFAWLEENTKQVA